MLFIYAKFTPPFMEDYIKKEDKEMKNLVYFLVGLFLLPIMMLPTCALLIRKIIIYIRDSGIRFVRHGENLILLLKDSKES